MYKTVWNKIKEFDSIVIYGHVNPDGDCYGSQLGLKRAILDNFENKKVYAVGSGYPRLSSLIGTMDEVDDETIKNSLSIVVDTSNQDRVEDQRYKLGLDVIKIDHHLPQEHFGNPELLETSRCSCTELICVMLLANEAKITKEAAYINQLVNKHMKLQEFYQILELIVMFFMMLFTKWMKRF